MADVARQVCHGQASGLGTGRVAVHFLSCPDPDGEWVCVVTPGGGERNVTVFEDNAFPLGDSLWRWQAVDDVSTYDYTEEIVNAHAAGPKAAETILDKVQ